MRFFAISRGLVRYGERLVGHDAALRLLADLRVRVYERLEALAPTGLPAFRRGDLLARVVEDVDALQDLMLRVIPPFGVALLVGMPTVGLDLVFPPLRRVWCWPRRSRLAAALRAVVHPLRWPAAGRRRQAAVRGELSTHVVDLLDGAAELVAFGAVDAQLARVPAADAELTRIATVHARTAGVGSGLITLLTGLAVWGILLVGVPPCTSGGSRVRCWPSSPSSRWRPSRS